MAAATEVQGQMSDLIALIPHPAEVLTWSNQQHRRLVAAIRDRDVAEATSTMTDHLRGTEHVLAGLLP
jgi:DNA-binding GntR family transcriptional regulator